MADIDNATLQKLASAIDNMTRMDMFPRSNEDRQMDALIKKVEDLESGNTKNTKYMIEAYNKALKQHGIAKEVKELKDVLAADDRQKALNSILGVLRSVDANQALTFENHREAAKTIEGLRRNAESAGMTLEQMGIYAKPHLNAQKQWTIKIKDQNRLTEELAEETEKYTDAIEEATDATEKYAKKQGFADKMIGKFTQGVKVVAKDFIRLAEAEQRFAQQNAVADAGWIDGLVRMQISTIDYMKILKETRRESLAMASAGRDFKDSLTATQQGLIHFTHDTTEAAQVSMAFHKNVARMGVSQNQLIGAADEQTKLYKEHYRVLGYSADEFARLTEELINDQGMRSTLLTLQEKERKAYIMGVQQRMAEYQTMGYTIERAKELQKTFQALVGMSPKERMKQAAKTRAMMGAMGMGAEGEELFQLQTRYRTMNAEQKAAADKRMAEIQSRAAGRFGAMSGAGTDLGQSMSMQMLAEKTGFTGIAEKFETASGEGLKVDEQQLQILKDQAKDNNEINKNIGHMLHAQSAWRAAEGTALSSIATNIVGGFATLNPMVKYGLGALVAAAGGAVAGTVLAGKMEEKSPDTWSTISMAVGKTVDALKLGFGDEETVKETEARLANIMKLEQAQERREEERKEQLQQHNDLMAKLSEAIPALSKSTDAMSLTGTAMKDLNAANSIRSNRPQ